MADARTYEMQAKLAALNTKY